MAKPKYLAKLGTSFKTSLGRDLPRVTPIRRPRQETTGARWGSPTRATRSILEDLKQVLGFFVLLLTLVGCHYHSQGTVVPTQPVEVATSTPQAQAVLIIDFNRGEIATYSAALTNGTTAYELLVEAAKSLGYRLETERFDFGVLVKAIGEAENTDERGWLYSINGQVGKVAADDAQVNPGDQVEWKYTNF